MKPKIIEMPALQFWLESTRAKEVVFIACLPLVIWLSWSLSNSIFIKESSNSVFIRPLAIFLPIPLFSSILSGARSLLLVLWVQPKTIAFSDSEHIKFCLERRVEFRLSEIKDISYQSRPIMATFLTPMKKNSIIVTTTHGVEIIKTSVDYEPLHEFIEGMSRAIIR